MANEAFGADVSDEEIGILNKRYCCAKQPMLTELEARLPPVSIINHPIHGERATRCEAYTRNGLNGNGFNCEL